MSSRIWLAVVVAVAAGSCRDRDPAPAAAGSGGTTGSATTARLGPGPQLPVLPDAAPAPDAQTPEARFDEESRDESWAGATEHELKRRLGKLPKGAELAGTECRSSQCKLTLAAGDASVLVSAQAAFESPLRGFATAILLGTPTIRTDGRQELTIYAQFDR